VNNDIHCIVMGARDKVCCSRIVILVVFVIVVLLESSVKKNFLIAVCFLSSAHLMGKDLSILSS